MSEQAGPQQAAHVWELRRSSPGPASSVAGVHALWLAGGLLLAVMLIHVLALAITGGPLTGPVSLRKPATFAETGWLLTWSLALVLPRLRTGRWQRGVIAGTAIAFGVGETTVIGIQAWRGVPSHYNFTTPLDAALIRGGAAGLAGILIIGVLVLIVATLRSSRTPPDLRLGVLAGAVVLLVGCLDGLAMVSINSGVYQGRLGSGFGRNGDYFGPGAATVGPDYLGFRPATAGGDLVLPHAIGVHGLVLLAVPTVLLMMGGVPATRRLRVAAVAAGSVLIAQTVLLIHAFQRQPLDRLGIPALTVLAVCSIGYLSALVAVAVALRGTALRPRVWGPAHGSGPSDDPAALDVGRDVPPGRGRP